MMSSFLAFWYFILVLSLCGESHFNTSKEFSRGGSHVLVYDDLFSSESIESIRSFFKEVSWEFQPHVSSSFCSECTRTFQSSVPVSAFSSSPTWLKINSVLVEQLENLRADGIYLLSTRGSLLAAGQQSIIQSCTENQKHVVIIFLNKEWKKNGYGELLVLDKKGEIAAAVFPKLGRIVVISCPSNYLIHSPSVNVPGRLYFIEVATTTSKMLFEKQKIEQQLMIPMREMTFMRKFADFDPSKVINTDSASSLSSLDVSKFVTHTYTTAKGKRILVFDNLLPKKDLDRLYDLMYHGIYHDSPVTEYTSTDNVQWVLGVETIPFLQTHLWTLVQKVVKLASGQDGFYPYDISCNHIQTFDRPMIHRDCEREDDEYTFMIYLNSNWTANHYGETVFFDEQNEIVAVVAPKHGRGVIFHGTIPHSARPPSPLFEGARFTFVVKMSSSKEKAFIKFAQDELSHGEDLDKEEMSEKDDSTSEEADQLRKRFYEAEDRNTNELNLDTPETEEEIERMEQKYLESIAEL